MAPCTSQNPPGRARICPHLYINTYMHMIIPILLCAYIYYIYMHIYNFVHTHIKHKYTNLHCKNIYICTGVFFSGPLNKAGMPTSASTGVASPYPRPSPALAETGCCTRGVFLRGDKEDNFTHPEPTASPRRARSQSGGTKAKWLRPTRPVGTWGFS